MFFYAKKIIEAIITYYECSTPEYTYESGITYPHGADDVGFVISPDGSKAYTINASTSIITQWTLTTPKDTSSMTSSGTYDATGYVNTGQGMAISPDGTNLIVASDGGDKLVQFSMSTGFDISTISYVGENTSYSGAWNVPTQMQFDDTGNYLFINDTNVDTFFKLDLPSSYSCIGTMTTAESFKFTTDISGYVGSTQGSFIFTNSGSTLYVIDDAATTRDMWRYDLSTPYLLSSRGTATKVIDNLNTYFGVTVGDFTSYHMAVDEDDSIYINAYRNDGGDAYVVLSMTTTATSPTDYIAYWKFENNLNDETSAYALTEVGALSYTASSDGNALTGFSSANYAKATIPEFSTPTNLSYSCVFNASSFGSDITLIGMGDFSVSHDFEIHANASTLYAYYYDTTSGVQTASAPLALLTDTEYHVAVTFEENNKVVVYLNGAQVASNTCASWLDYSRQLAVGVRATATPSYPMDTNGYIDNVQIYNRVLSPCEVNAIYNSYLNVPTDYIAYWKFEDNLTDETTTYNGTNAGSVTFVTGVDGKAANFPSDNTGWSDLGSITSADSLSFSTSQKATFSFLFEDLRNTGDSFGRILDKSTGGDGAGGYAIYTSSTATTTNINVKIDASTNTATAGYTKTGFVHVVITIDTSINTIKIYIDDVLVTTSTGITKTFPTTTANARIGNWQTDSSRELSGKLDDFRVYDRVLSSMEITALYNSYGL